MPRLDHQSIVTSTETAAVAELCFRDEDGSPRVEPVTPLVAGGELLFTLSYDRCEIAGMVERAGRVCVSFSDSRLARLGWSPLYFNATVSISEDPEGEFFVENLLEQEVRKYPPSERIIGSMLLRRDNWWYLPRLILRLQELDAPAPLARRNEPGRALLAWTGETEALEAATVEVKQWGAGEIPVRPVAGGDPLEGAATLYHHDFSVPDMDQTTTFTATGRLRDGRLLVSHQEGSPELGGRPGLISRLRGHYRLKTNCLRGLRRTRG